MSSDFLREMSEKTDEKFAKFVAHALTNHSADDVLAVCKIALLLRAVVKDQPRVIAMVNGIIDAPPENRP